MDIYIYIYIRTPPTILEYPQGKSYSTFSSPPFHPFPPSPRSRPQDTGEDMWKIVPEVSGLLLFIVPCRLFALGPETKFLHHFRPTRDCTGDSISRFNRTFLPSPLLLPFPHFPHVVTGRNMESPEGNSVQNWNLLNFWFFPFFLFLFFFFVSHSLTIKFVTSRVVFRSLEIGGFVFFFFFFFFFFYL